MKFYRRTYLVIGVGLFLALSVGFSYAQDEKSKIYSFDDAFSFVWTNKSADYR